MNQSNDNFLTPVGRIVAGDCFRGQDKDMHGKPYLDKMNTPFVKYFVGLAIRKDDPGWPALWGQIAQFGQNAWPQGQTNQPGFAWKVDDGDDPKHAGKTGYAGHFIMRMGSTFAPKCFRKGGTEQIVNPDEIKKGYYVRVYGSLASNREPSKPGLYLNLNLIELCGYGEEIVSGPNGAVFGEQPAAALPPGASQTPVAPQASIAQPQPQGYPPAQPQAQPQPQGYPPAQPQAQPQPQGYPPAQPQAQPQPQGYPPAQPQAQPQPQGYPPAQPQAQPQPQGYPPAQPQAQPQPQGHPPADPNFVNGPR